MLDSPSVKYSQKDIWDVRRIGEIHYGDPSYFNHGIQDLLAYYRGIGMI